jgi:ubiquitin C-terminal hydrolase
VFHEYFVTTEAYSRQLNLQNPQGYAGDLAESFAELVKTMYRDEADTGVLRNFKNVISQCSDQFQGYD